VTCGRPALLLLAAGLALAIPASAEAKLQFRPCGGATCAGLSVPLSNRLGPVRIDGPGSLDGVLRLSEGEDDLVLRVRGRLAGRWVRARVRIPTRFDDVVDDVEEGGGSARTAALGGLLR
jgi:hypothetical protein